MSVDVVYVILCEIPPLFFFTHQSWMVCTELVLSGVKRSLTHMAKNIKSSQHVVKCRQVSYESFWLARFAIRAKEETITKEESGLIFYYAEDSFF